jgi:hypothetical protein
MAFASAFLPVGKPQGNGQGSGKEDTNVCSRTTGRL